MIQAKRVVRASDRAKPDVATITAALAEYEAAVKALEQLGSEAKIDSFFISGAKSYLTSAKQFMRRIRDKEYGYCTKTGEAIGIPRLLARPTATVCVDVKGQDEKVETHFRDR